MTKVNLLHIIPIFIQRFMCEIIILSANGEKEDISPFGELERHGIIARPEQEKHDLLYIGGTV